MMDQDQHQIPARGASKVADSKSFAIGPGSSLIYRPLHGSLGIEFSDWKGLHGGPALSTHFHREAQITVVLSGVRWFSIRSRLLRLSAGHFVVIPPGVPHQAVGHRGLATQSCDLFFHPSSDRGYDHGRVLTGSIAIDRSMLLKDILESAQEQIGRECTRQMVATSISPLSLELIEAIQEDQALIADIAALAGMSREGFIRKFKNNVGMTPHAYRIADRVCRARENLRHGMPAAEAAYDAGFADQSHMGRTFRQLYGTTPAVFRKAWLPGQSHSFQIK